MIFVFFWLGMILIHSVSGVGETYNAGADNLSPKIERNNKAVENE